VNEVMNTHKSLNVLIVGGAGYIGSHMTKFLMQQKDMTVFVIDNLSTGHRDAVLTPHFFHIDLHDAAALHQFFQEHPIDVVMHFASSIVVSESVVQPATYYQNNLANSLNLLEAMRANQVTKFIFSSTAAVYGEPQYSPIDLQHPTAPLNPYGRSKRMMEQILADFAQAYSLQFISLRYFNAAGADPEGELGERHEPETHLIPCILQAAMRNEPVTIYGTDYDTPDGTAIRDYIHIQDLCQAHLNALYKLTQPDFTSAIYNLGSQTGYSVKEVVATAKKVTGMSIQMEYAPRREGDAAVLVAEAKLAEQELNWKPRFGLSDMVKHAWRFFTTRA